MLLCSLLPDASITQVDADALRAMFDGEALRATLPLLCIAAGAIALLLFDLIDPLRPLRPVAFLGSLAAAATAELRLVAEPAGSVLGGSYLADGTSALWGLIFCVGAALAWAYAHGYYGEHERPLRAEHDVLLLSATAGMALMVGAEDLILFFVGLELLSLPLYVLAAFRRARTTSIEAGIKYFLLGSFAAGLYLYGCALVYTHTGSIALAELAEHDELASGIGLAGLALISASLFFKVSVFPFHLWAPDVYEGAPTPVTAVMATGTKAAAFGFLIKLALLLPPEAAWTIALCGVLTSAAGNLGALVQKDLKRMLAYSGVAHAGTLLLVVAAAVSGGASPRDAVAATIFYMAAYLFTAMGAFGLIALLEGDGEEYSRIENLRGLARSRPGVAAAMSLFLLSLGGIPATAGFLGKWLVFAGLVQADMILWAVLGALLSVVALGYYLRVVIAMYMQAAPEGLVPPTTQRPWSAGLATGICALGVLLLGCAPGLLLAYL